MIRKKSPLAKKKKEPIVIGLCRDCAHATLLQWDKNPLITDCERGRMVGSMTGCEKWVECKDKREPLHLTRGQIFVDNQIKNIE
jgi:hypothetical protein